MISDTELCKDIAEFAHFAIALRGGLPSQAQFEAQQAQQTANRPAASGEVEASGSGSGTAVAAGGIGLLVVAGGGLFLLIALGLAAYFVL